MTTALGLRYCRRCVMPATRPDLSFDDEGVCDACRSNHLKDSIDWAARRAELEALLDGYRNRDGSNYDCIIPSSGGKDSTYQAYVIKHEFGLNPLCVTWTPCNQTELGKRNIENLQRLGVDYLEFTGNPDVYRKLVRLGFELIGDSCWPEHVGIFTLPIQVALRYRIPLVVYGERGQFEYGGPASSRAGVVLDRRWMEEFGGLRGLRVEDAMRLTGLGRRDMLPYLYPEADELERGGVKAIFLGQFLRWDARRQLEIVRKHGFSVNESGPQEGTYTNYENLDCKYVGLHDYLMYCKYGFGRATAHACIDIRNGRLDRAEALRLVKQYDGRVPRRYLDEFLREMQADEAWFFKICDVFTSRTAFVRGEDRRPLRDADGELVKINYDNDEPPAELQARLATVAARPRRATRAAVRAAEVTIVDYGAGNLRSVAKAFEALGHTVRVSAGPADVAAAERLVLPGVGAFADGMRQLRERGLLEPLRERVLGRRAPFLGICLGMQLLATRGREGGVHEGLGWIPGECVAVTPDDPALKVPHIGWNDVTPTGGSWLLRDVDGAAAFYFLHGYHLVPADASVVRATVEYGGVLVASVERDNVYATQFHPEKSQQAGLAVLRRFMQA
jgi:imidazole glycerol phosphate synthase glutamine amidotransferase subunit